MIMMPNIVREIRGFMFLVQEEKGVRDQKDFDFVINMIFVSKVKIFFLHLLLGDKIGDFWFKRLLMGKSLFD